MATVNYEVRDGIAILTLDNPPVNGLGAGVRTAFKARYETAEADPEVKAMVVAGAGRMFCAGADISEFGKPEPAGAPALQPVLDQMEAGEKPVVAAIHGVALGGGAEVTLACHYRVALKSARFGLPEVSLGIIPGAGGTQRLPRLIDVKDALDLITSGRLVAADNAKALGAIDEVVEDDVLGAAIAYAQKLVADGTKPRRSSEQTKSIEAAKADPGLFEDFKKTLAQRQRNLEAPVAAVDAVKAATELEFSAGQQRERDIFKTLVASDQSKALRYAFFIEREANKIDDVPKDTPVLPIKQAAIIGCGTMGGGIAMNFANGGIPVTVLESAQDALDHGLGVIKKNYAATVAKGRLKQDAMDERMALITGTTSYDDLANADIIIEAVFEDMDVKKEVFGKLDAVAKPEAILATNTSTLNIDAIAAATSRPEKVVGTHFFSPANVMRLLENVRGEDTSKETIATVMDLSKKIGKVGVLVGNCFGFVGNRMLYPYSRQANFLLEEGCLPQDVDRVIYDFGFAMGPFAVGDLAGLDIGYAVRKANPQIAPTNRRYSGIADKLVEMGRKGQKTKSGWYKYEDGSRAPVSDPAVEALIVKTSEELGIERRAISDEEILQRCMYPLINEGAKILEEGIAQRPSDIDVIWLYGYGFPRYRGGPMHYADTVGVSHVYDVMSKLYDTHGDWLEPSALLKDLAAKGKGFADL
ncbi:MAG TPA: 3-hydroxyacyl-CoA dehydrogenase NAD-binding domain-containing protein [Alphaproteobacteria bacterium]|nr:3-hydroxyacyl-CoA dehydrogenase NAD-binding domain-containing protein [Alphaproteobacteria bacterium]